MKSALLKLFRGGGVYALGVFLYSCVRQAAFFPIVHHYDKALFVKASFFLLLCDLLVFPIAGSLGDFYQRQHASKDLAGTRNKSLGVLCAIAILYFPVFVYFDFGYVAAICGVGFVGFYAKNNLVQRLVYNKLNFIESIKYNIFRVVPFALLAALMASGVIFNLDSIAMSVFIFEAAYYFVFLKNIESKRSTGLSEILACARSFAKSGGGILLISTVCGAYLHRGEMLVAGIAWTNDYPLVVMVCTLANIFITPISLVFSTPLMSFLVSRNVSLNSEQRRKVAFVIIGFSVFIAIVGYAMFPYILSFMYGESISKNWNLALSFSIFSLSVFFLGRTFVAKFASQKGILFSNIFVLALTLPMVFLNEYVSFILFWLVFSFCRGFFPIYYFVSDVKS